MHVGLTHVLAGWPSGVIPIVNGEIASGEPHRDAALHASSLKTFITQNFGRSKNPANTYAALLLVW